MAWLPLHPEPAWSVLEVLSARRGGVNFGHARWDSNCQPDVSRVTLVEVSRGNARLNRYESNAY